MQLKKLFKLIPAVIFAAVTLPLFSQVAPSARAGGQPLSIGAGFSNFNPDWHQGRMSGGTVWIDYFPVFLPTRIQGLGAEIEARDLSIGHSSSQPSNLREDTASGGLIYSWRHYQRFFPYVKGLIGYGSVDFRSSNPYYSHDTRTVSSFGGGAEFRVYRSIWARADYEYQSWPNFPGQKQTFHPQGFTVGAMYSFGGAR